MDIVTIAFHAVSCLLALLASSLLLFVNEERRHSSRLLAGILLIFAIQNLVFLLLFTRLMLSVPWFLRLAAPTTFLIGPLSFLYFRSVLKDESSLRKLDWLLFIPSVLTIINFIPYYLLPLQEKIDHVNRYFYGRRQAQDPGTGLVPGLVYYIIRFCWSGIFVYGSLRLLRRFRKEASTETLSRNKVLVRWLFSFLGLLVALWLASLFRLIIPTAKDSMVSPADMMLGATSLYMCFQLFLHPQILYGVFQPLPVYLKKMPAGQLGETASGDVQGQVAMAETGLLDIAEQVRYKKLVEEAFGERKVFLQRDYSLDQLVKDTRIPRYALSAFINREYGMGFREFLNRRRIDHMTAHIGSEKWRNYTLEAMALESGFASRITFFKNLKQITGQTPTEYFKSVRLPGASQDA